MKIGSATWTATRASAYLRDGRLKILASRSRKVEGKRVRQSLTLSISDFEGPGTYSLSRMSSNFTSVGLDLAKVGGDPEAAAEELMRGASSGSSVLLLEGARVTIRSVDAKQVEGVFSWEDPTGRSSLTDGSFRAIVKKRRKDRKPKRD